MSVFFFVHLQDLVYLVFIFVHHLCICVNANMYYLVIPVHHVSCNIKLDAHLVC